MRVSGTLAVDGKPVSKGTVHFHPEKGRAATGIVEEVPSKDGDTESKSLIPPKFANPDKSGIQLEIPAAGYSNLQIDIVGNGVKIKEGRAWGAIGRLARCPMPEESGERIIDRIRNLSTDDTDRNADEFNI